MKLVTYLNSSKSERLGILANDKLYDLQQCGQLLELDLPDNMLCFLKAGEPVMKMAKQVLEALNNDNLAKAVAIVESEILAPVTRPPSCRDAYAFRQHVATARRNRGVPMIEEFDQYPVFYFTNHNSIIGPGELSVEDDHLHKLDFELEAAVVIGKHGRNISASEADSYIAGYTIMNDFSARLLQMEEMKLNLGPAKGKDFATAIGPWLVTPDELEAYRVDTSSGTKFDLRMTAHHNGELISEGNLGDMNWTFAEIIERVSYGVDIYPGDVIGSGTVGTGCYMELNGTRILEAKAAGKSYDPIWLASGDSIELEIAGLGKLRHTIVKNNESHSILAKKKLVTPAAAGVKA